MRGAKCEGFFRQLQRCIRVTFGQFLLQNALNSDKPCAVLLQHFFVIFERACAVPRLLRRLGAKQSCQFGAVQQAFRFGCLGHRFFAFAGGQGHHAISQCVKAATFTFTAPISG